MTAVNARTVSPDIDIVYKGGCKLLVQTACANCLCRLLEQNGYGGGVTVTAHTPLCSFTGLSIRGKTLDGQQLGKTPPSGKTRSAASSREDPAGGLAEPPGKTREVTPRLMGIALLCSVSFTMRRVCVHGVLVIGPARHPRPGSESLSAAPL